MGLFKRIFGRKTEDRAGDAASQPAAWDALRPEERERINRSLDKFFRGVTTPEGAAEYRETRAKELQIYKLTEGNLQLCIDDSRPWAAYEKERTGIDGAINNWLKASPRVLEEAKRLTDEVKFREADKILREAMVVIKEEINQAKRKKQREANLSKEGDAKDLQTHFPEAYVSVEEADWNGVLKQSPLKFCDNLLDGLPLNDLDSKHYHIEFKKAGAGGFVFSLNLEDPAPKKDGPKVLHGENLISLTRTITVKDGKISMGDERTDVNDKLKPAGGCKELYKNLLPLYTAMGVEEVTMSADEVGSYAWVRYGFRPSDKQEWVKLREEIGKRLSSLMAEPPIDRATKETMVIDKETQKKIERILKSDDPSSIVAIADMENSDGQKIGYPLLYKLIWKGTLRLKDEAIVKSVKKYIGLEQ